MFREINQAVAIVSIALATSGCLAKTSVRALGRSTSPVTTSLAPVSRIAVRAVAGRAEFYDLASGSRFIPRGTTYTRLAPDPVNPAGSSTHFTFVPGTYDATRIDAALAGMQALGYNVVRAFL